MMKSTKFGTHAQARAFDSLLTDRLAGDDFEKVAKDDTILEVLLQIFHAKTVHGENPEKRNPVMFLL